MARNKKKSFFATFLADGNVAAVSPSSPHLIKRLLRHLNPAKIRTLVELGPADGVATKPILAKLPPDAHLIAVETNPIFLAALRTLGDRRLEVIAGDARRLDDILAERGLTAVDAVIASIPFTYLSKRERQALVTAARKALRPDGVFIIFHQYSPLMLPYVKKEFSRVELEFEPLNVFPCFLLACRP